MTNIAGTAQLKGEIYENQCSGGGANKPFWLKIPQLCSLLIQELLLEVVAVCAE